MDSFFEIMADINFAIYFLLIIKGADFFLRKDEPSKGSNCLFAGLFFSLIALIFAFFCVFG